MKIDIVYDIGLMKIGIMDDIGLNEVDDLDEDRHSGSHRFR